MDKYLQAINEKTLIGKTFKVGLTKYTIIQAQKELDGLYLAIANLGPKTFCYGKEHVISEIMEYNKSGKRLSNFNKTDLWSTTPVVIKVSNLFLRTTNNCGDSIQEFEVLSNAGDKLFSYVSSIKTNNELFNDPFARNGKNITRIEDLNFRAEEKQLRKIFIECMPVNIRQNYIKDFERMCFSAILQRNKETAKVSALNKITKNIKKHKLEDETFTK